MTLRNLPPVKSHRKVRFCRFIVLKLNKRCLFEVIEVGFFYIDSAENFWRAHTSRVTGYVTYTSHQNSRIFLLPHLFLPFQRVQGGEGGSKEDRSVELKCWLLGCSDDWGRSCQERCPSSHRSSFSSSLQVVADDQVVLTSSTDCSVRLWSERGEFIGECQVHPFDLYEINISRRLPRHLSSAEPETFEKNALQYSRLL